MKYKSSILALILIPFFLASIYFFSHSKFQSYRKPYYFAPPDIIKYFAFGFNDVYADLLWIRYIQDADFCNFEQGVPIYDGKTKYQCHLGWSYYMAQAITELAPRFKAPYMISGTILSVLMNDKKGAQIIADKAVKQFPNDWDVFFHAGYHYLLELEQPEQAARYLLRAAELGGPIWLYSLSAKLYTKAGRLDVAEKFLNELLERKEYSSHRKTFEMRLDDIQEKRDNLKKEKNSPQALQKYPSLIKTT